MGRVKQPKDWMPKIFLFLNKHLSVSLIVSFSLISVVVAGMILTLPRYNVVYGDDYYSIPAMSIHENSINSVMDHLLENIQSSSRPAQEVFAHIAYGALGNQAPKILPIITIVWMCVLIYLLVKKVPKTKVGSIENKLVSASFSIFVTIMIIFANQSIFGDGSLLAYQLFFFTSAMVTYTLPLLTLVSVVYTLMLSRVSKKINHKISLLVLFVLSFILFTSNEVMAPGIAAVVASLLILQGVLTLFKSGFFFGRKAIHTMAILLGSAILSILFIIPKKASRLTETAASSADYSLLTNIYISIGETAKVLKDTFLQPTDLIFIAAFSVSLVIIIKWLGKTINQKKLYQSTLCWGFILLGLFFLSVYVSRVLHNAAYGLVFYQVPRTMLIPQIISVLTMALITIGAAGLLVIFTKNRVVVTIILILSLAALFIAIPRLSLRASTQLDVSIHNFHRWHERNQLINNAINSSEERVFLEDTTDGVSDSFTIYCSEELQNDSWLWYRKAVFAYYDNKIEVCNMDDKNKSDLLIHDERWGE